MIPSAGVRRHRDGGFVATLYGDTWMLEVTLAPRRRDRYGLGKPFSVTLTTGMVP